MSRDHVAEIVNAVARGCGEGLGEYVGSGLADVRREGALEMRERAAEAVSTGRRFGKLAPEFPNGVPQGVARRIRSLPLPGDET
jgi:hypothetical protein